MALLDANPRSALQFIGRSIDYDPNWAPAFNELGKVYVTLNDYYHGEGSYLKAIQLQPSWVFPQLNLAGVYLHQKDWPRAEQAYLRAADLDNTLATPWYFLGQVYEAESRPIDAVNAYTHAVDLAANRSSSAFNVDALQKRIQKLQQRNALTPR